MRTLAQNNLRAWRIRRHLRKNGIKCYSRRQWGSVHKDIYAYRRRYKPVTADPADTVVQHITVTSPTTDFLRDVRIVESIGMQRFGSGVSYNYLVNMATGEIAEGQPLDAKGTHTVNDKKAARYSYDQNAVARAIAVVGMPDTPLSRKARRSLVILLRALVKYRAITPDFDYEPHSTFAYKDCPCSATRNLMTKIRSRV